MATLTIQPSNADSALVANAPDDLQGTVTTIHAGLSGGTVRRAIVQFDFSALPVGVSINSATLSLYHQFQSEGDQEGETFWAYRLTQTGWAEDQVTWNDYLTSTPWATAGGDFTTTSGSSIALPAIGNSADWDVTTLVEYFRDNDSDIANFMIQDGNESSGNGVAFFPSNNFLGTTSLRPKLVIDYSPQTSDAAFDLPVLNVQAAGAPGAEFTFPALSVQAFGASAAELTFPVLSVQGGSGATGQFSFSALTLSAAGHETNEASLTFPVLTLFAVPPPTTITLPVLSVSAEVTTKGTFDKSLPVLTLSATADPLRGVVQITLPQFTTTLSAIQGSADGTTINLPAFTISIRTGLTVSNVLPQFTIAATAQVGAVGTYNKSLPRMTITAGATQQSRATNDITLPVFTLDATLKTGEISLTSTRNLPGLRLSATGFVGVPGGDVDLTFPAFELATFGYQSINGTVVQSLKMLTLNAYADSYTNRII
ncbi:MAG: DNRLRE domain-containing protein [Candidatus Scalindua sp.]